MGISLVNQRGADSWPITGASFAIMYKEPGDKNASKETIKFFDWAFKSGKQMALDLEYVPLPDSLTQAIASKVWSQIKH
jgi:phosphate transport system substrate-binding protein